MDKSNWLKQPADAGRAKKLKRYAWATTAAVFLLVGAGSRIHVALPPGLDTSLLPPFYSALNVLVAVALIAAVYFIKAGNVEAHRRSIFVAMTLSAGFLIAYVIYHMTSDPTRFGGEGIVKVVYYTLLLSHILLAAISLPLILLTFIYGYTNHFSKHRKMARRVFPLWLYVSITGPVCYLMLIPYY